MAHLPDKSRTPSTTGGTGNASRQEQSEAGQNTAPPVCQETLALATDIMQKRFFLLDTSIPGIDTLLELASKELANKFALGEDTPARYAISPEPTEEELCPKPPSKAAMLAAGAKIGTLPTIFYSLLDAVNNRYASSADIATVIAKDPALSAKLLRLINSPFYGLRHPVDDITRAVTIVGNGPLVMLTMGTVLVSSFKKVPNSLLDMRSFWLHCIATGIFARILANRMNQANPEHFFITGLLHDIGRLIMFVTPPPCALHLIMDSHRRRIPMHVLEKDLLGFSHESLAADLLKSWNCPPVIIESILHHHEPLDSKITIANAILPVANTLSTAMGYGSSGSFLVPVADQFALELVGITPSTLPVIISEAHQVIQSTSNAMLTPDGGDQPS